MNCTWHEMNAAGLHLGCPQAVSVECCGLPRITSRMCRRSQESKLVLHRHWSLVDSMTHTPDVMAHLETFREGNNGRQQLFGVLATSGIPVHQVRCTVGPTSA